MEFSLLNYTLPFTCLCVNGYIGTGMRLRTHKKLKITYKERQARVHIMHSVGTYDVHRCGLKLL